MALRAVPNHPKFARLKALINQPKGCVLGWLESIWHFTGAYAPQGNIGRFSDEEIEASCEWNGEPGKLVWALIEAKWIDRDPTHRLIVHDWHEHADKATKQSLKNKNLSFLVPSVRPVGTQLDTKIEIGHTHSPKPLESVQVCAPPEAGAGAVPEAGAGAVQALAALPLDYDPEENIPDGLSLVQYRQFVCQRLGEAESYRNQVAFQDAIAAVSKHEGVPIHEAARIVINRARDNPAGDGKWRFWVDDGGWKARQEFHLEVSE